MTVPILNAAIQGQGTISADNLNTYIQTALTAAQLRTFVGLPGMVVNLQGILFPADGEGGFFYWDQNGTHSDDNFNFIVPTASGTGEWVRFTIESPTSSLNYTSFSINSTVSATGTNQATSTVLTAQINIVTSVASGTGIQLPLYNSGGGAIPVGTPITVYNRGANILTAYPPSGYEIETLGSNNPVTVAINGNATFTLINLSKWVVK